jgi:hypothetical protein
MIIDGVVTILRRIFQWHLLLFIVRGIGCAAILATPRASGPTTEERLPFLRLGVSTRREESVRWIYFSRNVTTDIR